MLMPSAAAMKTAKQRPGDQGKREKGGKVDPRDVPDPSEVAATAQSAKMRSLVVDLLPPLTPFAADAFDHHQGMKQGMKQGTSSGVVKTEIKAESNTESTGESKMDGSTDGSTALGGAAAALWERSLITPPFDEYGADAGQTRLAVKPLPPCVREAALGLNPTQVRGRINRILCSV
jgi:hypothetical protein